MSQCVVIYILINSIYLLDLIRQTPLLLLFLWQIVQVYLGNFHHNSRYSSNNSALSFYFLFFWFMG